MTDVRATAAVKVAALTAKAAQAKLDAGGLTDDMRSRLSQLVERQDAIADGGADG